MPDANGHFKGTGLLPAIPWHEPDEDEAPEGKDED